MPPNPLEEFITALKQPVGSTGTVDELYMKDELTDDDWTRASQRLSEDELLRLRTYHDGKSYDRGQPPVEVVEEQDEFIEKLVSEAHDDPEPITPEIGAPSDPIEPDEAMDPGVVNYDEWRVPQLQEELRKRDASPTGTKPELVERLEALDRRAGAAS